MQRGFTSSFDQEAGVDTQALLESDGFFGEDEDVFRSVTALESEYNGLGSLGLDDVDRRAAEPVYRSIAAEQPAYGNEFGWKAAAGPYENPMLAAFPAPSKAKQKQPPKFGTGFQVQVAAPKQKPSRPQLRENLVPKWGGYITQNAEALPGRDFKQTWTILTDLVQNVPGVNDYKINEQAGEITLTYWGSSQPTTVTVNIYQDKNTREFKIDFVRRSGNCFDFHRIKEEVLFALLQKPRSPRLDFKNMKDPETGKNMSEMLVEEADLNDWAAALKNSHLELRRELTAILARASEHSAEVMRKHSRIIEELYTSAFMSDTVCTRYAMVALTNLLREAPLCSRRQLDQIFDIAKDSNLKEVQKRCYDAINAVMQSGHHKGLEERAGRYLEQIKCT